MATMTIGSHDPPCLASVDDDMRMKRAQNASPSQLFEECRREKSKIFYDDVDMSHCQYRRRRDDLIR